MLHQGPICHAVYHILTLYFSPCTELATRCVTLPLKSRRILPPMWWTRLQSLPSSSFFRNPVQHMIRLLITEQYRGLELYGKGCPCLAHKCTIGGPMILCSSLRKSSKSSPSNGSHTKTSSMLSVTACTASLTFSDMVTGTFRDYRKRAKKKISDLEQQQVAVTVFNKLMSVFHASVLLLIMNFIITLSKLVAVDPWGDSWVDPQTGQRVTTPLLTMIVFYSCDSGTGRSTYFCITTVFVDTQLWKTKHLRKHFQNFRQSYVLSTCWVKIH